MESRVDQTIRELSAVAEDARATFGGLSGEQLNWKPSGNNWSIAQCFDHLITTHSLYFPVFERLAAEGYKPTTWEKISPLSGFFGRFLIKSLRPENVKKTKTTAKAFPSSSEISDEIIERYCGHQDELIDHIKNLPAEIDPAKTIITSPLMGLVTYSLEDCFTILAIHGPRHFNQAKRVMETDGFPTS